MEDNKKVTILYTNWKGETKYRNIIPMSVEGVQHLCRM